MGFVVNHAAEHQPYVQVLPLLHPEALTEVLMSRHLTPEEYAAEKERMMRMFGPEAFARALGPEVLAHALDSDQMKEFIRAAGPARIQELLDEMKRAGSSAGDPSVAPA